MKTVLFLCTGNFYRSRFAEEVFNHLSPRACPGMAGHFPQDRGGSRYQQYRCYPPCYRGVIRGSEHPFWSVDCASADSVGRPQIWKRLTIS